MYRERGRGGVGEGYSLLTISAAFLYLVITSGEVRSNSFSSRSSSDMIPQSQTAALVNQRACKRAAHDNRWRKPTESSDRRNEKQINYTYRNGEADDRGEGVGEDDSRVPRVSDGCVADPTGTGSKC